MISKIQFISNDFNRSHIENIELACKCGIKWVQLRVKNQSEESYESIAKSAQDICVKYNTTLIINDNWELANKILADGVHVGLEDTPVNLIKDAIGEQFIIGGTANSYNDIIRHYNHGADYVGVGPYQHTETKKNLSPILGINGYKEIITKLNSENISIPLIAIGGIHLNDIKLLKEVGIYGIAFSTLLTNADEPQKVAYELFKYFD